MGLPWSASRAQVGAAASFFPNRDTTSTPSLLVLMTDQGMILPMFSLRNPRGIGLPSKAEVRGYLEGCGSFCPPPGKPFLSRGQPAFESSLAYIL